MPAMRDVIRLCGTIQYVYAHNAPINGLSILRITEFTLYNRAFVITDNSTMSNASVMHCKIIVHGTSNLSQLMK